ncbi:hypothetical protein SP90_11215 [Halodesulfovibrio spirochaetisodalis]|uniref:Uncharacterized protein n=2 Tax=Halodesulfovibrio spirochaetisodalis TaxID=1560234 RepID=A0A1B7XBF2_9BACT|nr:hypothetical protein SP90_11215 [Halodesulfovibrio spirochaetisodalis]
MVELNFVCIVKNLIGNLFFTFAWVSISGKKNKLYVTGEVMLRGKYVLLYCICCLLLTGCMNNEPDGTFSKVVYSTLSSKHKDNVKAWSEDIFSDGALVKADKAFFWVDSEYRVVALNRRALAMADPQSGVSSATPQLLSVINRSLAASGKKSLSSQGGWKHFKWN